MAAIVEMHHDERGIVWPTEIAPFQVHLVGLNLEDKNVSYNCYTLYNNLLDKGFEVLFDDRLASPGEKFADADLIGIPIRLVVSKKQGIRLNIKKG